MRLANGFSALGLDGGRRFSALLLRPGLSPGWKTWSDLESDQVFFSFLFALYPSFPSLGLAFSHRCSKRRHKQTTITNVLQYQVLHRIPIRSSPTCSNLIGCSAPMLSVLAGLIVTHHHNHIHPPCSLHVKVWDLLYLSFKYTLHVRCIFSQVQTKENGWSLSFKKKCLPPILSSLLFSVHI